MLFCASIPQRVREMASRIDPDKRRDGDRIATTSIEALLVDGRDDDFRELIALLYATSGRLQSMRRELATALSLSIAEFAVLSALMYLAPKGNTRIGTIAEHLHIAAAQVTAIVNRLARAGWVEKSVDPSDRRALRLRLTPMANDRLAGFMPLLQTVNDSWFAGMSRTELRTVGAFLRRLVDQYARADLKVKEARS